MAQGMWNRLARSLFILLTLLALVLMEMAIVEAKLCERPSETWSGFCDDSGHCNDQCKNWENADHGACHFDFPGMACFCYFNC